MTRTSEALLERAAHNTASAPTAMAVTAHPAATEAAVEILRRGGNAVDAALAAAWTLSVCEPSGSGLGGQATMLIHQPNGTSLVLDGHSHGPKGLSRRNVSRAQQSRGHRACTLPSMPATLGAAHDRLGRLPFATTLEPSIELAEAGFPVTRLLRRHIQWCRGALAAHAGTANLFLPQGRPPKVGSILRQPALAETLRRLGRHGVDDLYRGGLAEDVVNDMERHDGLIRAEDLHDFSLPIERAAMTVSYRDYDVMSVPPPGGGLQVLLGLRLAEALSLESTADDPAAWYATLATITHAIFRERSRWPLRPEQVTPSMLEWLLSRERAREIVAELRAAPAPPVRSAEGPGDTTHLCIVDGDGMVVSLTQSIQSLFGAKVANEKLGFVYNNYLCTCPRYRHPSQLGPHAMPQSNAAPTIVFTRTAGDRVAVERVPALVLGSAGSRRITSSILHVLTNVIDRGMSLPDAIDAPRIHVTLSGRPMVEKRIASEELEQKLHARFRPSQVKAERSYSMGAVQAIARTGDQWVGAADPRREGAARGL